MIRHSLMILLELFAGLLAILIIAGGFVGWRLTQGPLQVDWLTPYVEEAVNRNAANPVSIGSTRLSWAGWGAPLQIQALDFAMLGEAGRTVAAVPELRIALSIQGLLRLTPIPTEVALVRPRLTVIRTADGGLTLESLSGPPEGAVSPAASPSTDGTPVAESDEDGQLVAELLDALRNPPDASNPLTGSLGALRTLRIDDAALTLDDRMTGRMWQAPVVSVQLNRNQEGLSGTANVELDIAGRLNRFAASISHRRTDGSTDVGLQFTDIQVAALAELAPVLDTLRMLDVALSGSVNAHFKETMVPEHLDLKLTGSAGRLIMPDEYPEPLPFQHVELAGRLQQAGQLLTVDRFLLDFGRPRLSVSGTVARTVERVNLSLVVDLKDLPMAQLSLLWPKSVKDNIREWMVDNLSAGTFDSSRFELDGWAPSDRLADLTPTRMAANFAFSGFGVRYMDTLPPIKGVKGTASFDGAAMTATLTEGHLLELVLGPSSVRIHGLDTDDHKIDVRVPLSGPVSAALAVLDHPPLGYATLVNLVPAEVGGTTQMDLHFAFPLVKDLEMDAVRIDGRARLADVSAAGIVPDVRATEGIFDLTVTDHNLRMTGSAKLNGVPSQIDWKEEFADRAPTPTRVAIQARLDDAGRKAFSLDFPGWINGPAGVDMTYIRPRAGADRIEAALDLKSSTLLIDVMKWRKPQGQAAEGHLVVEFVDGKPLKLKEFRVSSADLLAEGRAWLRPADFGLQRVELDRFRLLETTDATLSLQTRSDGGMDIEARGSRFDARPLRKDDEVEKAARKARRDRREQAPNVEAPDVESPVKEPLKISFTLDQVTMGDDPGQQVRKVVGSAFHNGRIWEQADVDAAVSDTGTMRLRYRPDGDMLSLQLDSDDAGAMLRSLDVLTQVRGGKLSVTGKSDPKDRDKTVTGQIEMLEYQIHEAPVLTRILSAASPRGFANFLSGQPIAFSRLIGNFSWHRHGISFRDLQTSGSEVGLTMEGDIDLLDDRLNLQGTVVPFSSFNRLLGAIPLFGDILSGGEGQGLFAATYSVKGSPDEPDISVNPLSVLAPGFLRNLFFQSDMPGDPAKRSGGGSGGGEPGRSPPRRGPFF
jgi:hypothetical protein